MKLPTVLDKSTLDINKVAQEIVDEHVCTLTTADVKAWLVQNDADIYVFDVHEPDFADWSEEDYVNNMSQNEFEPYAWKTKNYVVLHDYFS
jgi:hypothetical protein